MSLYVVVLSALSETACRYTHLNLCVHIRGSPKLSSIKRAPLRGTPGAPRRNKLQAVRWLSDVGSHSNGQQSCVMSLLPSNGAGYIELVLLLALVLVL